MKKILITGANSYIGNSVQAWLEKEPEKYQVTTIDMKTDEWKEKDFSPYDVVFHVAGIAHVSTDPKMEDLYYKVNRDLTIQTAKKAKKEGVNQFIFMSSIIVYGDSNEKNRIITKDTVPNPTNFYGKSKLEAEEGILKFQSADFNIAIIRPPMIYGKGSKGNYPRLAKAAKILPFFPNISNSRSMLYIGNLCEFVKKIIELNVKGILFPQNEEYVCTSQLVKTISQNHNKKLILTKLFNPIVNSLFYFNTINKVFGNLIYDSSISNEIIKKYQIFGFKQSISLTEEKK